MIDDGPIEKGSTLASLLISIIDSKMNLGVFSTDYLGKIDKKRRDVKQRGLLEKREEIRDKWGNKKKKKIFA
jgi:hypothetical protein